MEVKERKRGGGETGRPIVGWVSRREGNSEVVVPGKR
jgi:hypothetical protein